MGKYFTVQGGAKRPSNVDITCNQNLSFPTFFPINVMKKGRPFYLFQEILGNLYDRTGVEVIRTPSIRHVSGQVRADLVGFIDFLPRKNNWNFLIPISWLGPNFSQIGKVTWPRFFFKVRKLLLRLLLFINCSVEAVISLCIGQFLFLGKK